MTLLASRLARWSHGLALGRVPPEVAREAIRCIVDVTGVALAGSAHRITQAASVLAAEDAPRGLADIWGSATTTAAGAAAQINGTAAHVLDYDDTCYDGIVHGSAAVWPAVLACAQACSASGERALEAFIAGVETEYALGRALPDRVYFDGWWTSGVLGAIGAAAGAAKVLELTVTETASAIGLAACQAAGMRAMIGTDAKPYAIGLAARTGVEAARFARAGLSAPADAFESDRGFIKLFAGGEFDDERFGLGERYSLMSPGVAYKLYPACSATQAATEAVLRLVTDHELAPEDIAAIECDVTPLVAISLMYDRPATVTEAQFSLPYALACAVRYRDFGVLRMNQPSFDAPEMVALMSRVSMRRDDALEATDQGRDHPEGARVTIRLNGGGTLQRYNGAATGMPQKPMSDAALDEKFIACASTAMPPAASGAMLARLRGLRRCRDVRELFA